MFQDLVGVVQVQLLNLKLHYTVGSRIDTVSNNKIKHIRFEDLILDYDNTVQNIFDLLKINYKKHSYLMKHFKPQMLRKCWN